MFKIFDILHHFETENRDNIVNFLTFL